MLLKCIIYALIIKSIRAYYTNTSTIALANTTDASDQPILKYINVPGEEFSNSSNPFIVKRQTDEDDFLAANETYYNITDEEYANETSYEEYINEIRNFIFPKTWTWVLICFHFVVFTVGLVGNTLVCVAVYRNHSMRTVTNYFIVNLALADFLVILFCLPPTVIWDVTLTWFFGIAMCKIVLYLQLLLLVISTISLINAVKEKRSYFLHDFHHHDPIVINKHIPYPVPKPYPVPVEKHVPYPVEVIKENYKPYPVTVIKDVYKPYSVVKEVPEPYPVTLKKLVPRPYPVEVTKTYPVKVPVKVDVPHYVHVPVPKPYHVPVHIDTHSNSESYQHTYSNHYVNGGYNTHSKDWKW